MAQAESRLSRQILSELRSRGIFANKNHGGPTMMAGLPDITACVEGLYVGLEVKHPHTRNDLSPRQLYVHDKIREAGGFVAVVCSVAEAVDVVNARVREVKSMGDRSIGRSASSDQS